MEKEKLTFEHYLSDISPDSAAFAAAVHGNMTQAGFGVAVKEAKSGHVVSYTDKRTKKVAANLVSRKGGPVIRIYGDHCAAYADKLQALPENMQNAVRKSADCKRLLNPEDCNSRCPMGYTIELADGVYKKCRYGAMMFALNAENTPHVLSLLESEIGERENRS